MRIPIKSNAERAVSVTYLLLGHFNMMPVILGLVLLQEKKKELFYKVHRQRPHLKRQTNLDRITFNRLPYEVAQQPA